MAGKIADGRVIGGSHFNCFPPVILRLPSVLLYLDANVVRCLYIANCAVAALTNRLQHLHSLGLQFADQPFQIVRPQPEMFQTHVWVRVSRW